MSYNEINRFSDQDPSECVIMLSDDVYGEYPEILYDLSMEEIVDILRFLYFDENILTLYWGDIIEGEKFPNEMFYFGVTNAN